MKRINTTVRVLLLSLFLSAVVGCGPDLDEMTISDCFPFACSPTTAAPSVATEAATDLTASSAVLNGHVNPNWKDTGAWFEWGIQADLSDGIRTTSQFVGSGDRTIPYTALLEGLSSGTTYYYRAVAYNLIDTSYGSIRNFTPR